jgi:hypothetical protein
VFQVFCLDGDASVIMHMGALSIIGQMSPRNLKHIVFNNGVHDSVGGQQTAAFNSSKFHLTDIAINNGYTQVLYRNVQFFISNSCTAHSSIVRCKMKEIIYK